MRNDFKTKEGRALAAMFDEVEEDATLDCETKRETIDRTRTGVIYSSTKDEKKLDLN